MQIPANTGWLAFHPLSLTSFLCVRVMMRPPQGAAERIKGSGNNVHKVLGQDLEPYKHTGRYPQCPHPSGQCRTSSALQPYPPALWELAGEWGVDSCPRNIRIQGAVQLIRQGVEGRGVQGAQRAWGRQVQHLEVGDGGQAVRPHPGRHACTQMYVCTRLSVTLCTQRHSPMVTGSTLVTTSEVDRLSNFWEPVRKHHSFT